MADGLLHRGWHGRPWVFLRVIPEADPRAGGFYELTTDGDLRVPFEVVHAPGFAMWATDAMQQRLAKLLERPAAGFRDLLEAPARIFSPGQPPRDYDHYRDSLPRAMRRKLRRRQPQEEASYGTGLALLTPDNKLLGFSSFATVFNVSVADARARQPAATRLATFVGLIATAFEEPGRVWGDDQHYPQIMPTRSRPASPAEAREAERRSVVLRLAMLKAIPAVIDSLPEDGSPHLACERLLVWVAEELFPERGSRSATVEPQAMADVFHRELLAWPNTIQDLLFNRAGEGGKSATLGVFHAMVRARLTPDQLSALLMAIWKIQPLDDRERNRLKTHRCRARARLRAAQKGGDL